MTDQQAPPPPQEYYAYSPSLAGGVITAIIFVLLLGLHLYKLCTTRVWFCIPFSIGAIFETVGFGARAQSNKSPHSMAAFLTQAILVLLAPILFAASVYMFLGRIIRFTGYVRCAPIRPKFLTWIFITGDIVCFFVQMVGAAIMGDARTKAALDRAETIVLVGLVAQIFIFLVFMFVVIVFHKRIRSMRGSMVIGSVDWERFLFALYGVSAVITFRNLFRVIKYAMGDDGYLLSTEWPVYVFDTIPMMGVLVACSWWYIEVANCSQGGKGSDRLIPGPRGERLNDMI